MDNSLKSSIRKEYLKRRDQLSLEDRILFSNMIFESISKSCEFSAADNIFIYVDFRSEVITRDFITRLLDEGKKKIFVPKVVGDRLAFYRISSMKDLKPGYMGILEPDDKLTEYVICKGDESITAKNESAKKFLNMVFLPGSVFDRFGNRFGYGGGFYDRFLKEFPNCYKIGVLFSCQLFDGVLPAQDYDVPLDMLVTEDDIYRVNL